MEVLNGSDLMLFIKQGTVIKTIAFATSHKVSIKRDIKKKSSKDSGKWTNKKYGRFDWSISADAMTTVDEGAFSFDMLYTLWVTDTVLEVYSCLATGTPPDWVKSTTGGYHGKALISSLELEAKDEEHSTFSIALEGEGELLPGD